MAQARLMAELKREYEAERRAALQREESRRRTLYEKLPRVADIDNQVSLLGASSARAMLKRMDRRASAEPVDTQRILDANQAEIAMLLAEREALLQAADVPSDYLTNVFKCPLCEDKGYVNNARCACMKQRLINKYYKLSNLGGTMEQETFETFNLDLYANEPDEQSGVSPRMAMRKVFSSCIKFVDEFDSTFENLLMYGPTGLGKTFLCNCMAKEIMERGKTVLYATAGQLFGAVEKARFSREEDSARDAFLAFVTEADLLIIDDLGTEFSTSLTSAELFGFINQRLLDQKHTIISTNLKFADLETQYSDRTISRLVGNYTILRFVGDDIRVKQRFGG